MNLCLPAGKVGEFHAIWKVVILNPVMTNCVTLVRACIGFFLPDTVYMTLPQRPIAVTATRHDRPSFVVTASVSQALMFIFWLVEYLCLTFLLTCYVCTVGC